MRKFEKVSEEQFNDFVILPRRSTRGSAGYDFFMPTSIAIAPHTTIKIETGIKARMEEDDVLLLFIRSSIGIKRNLGLPNGVAVIDNDYYNNKNNEGNIIIAIHNYGDETQYLETGERVMQGVFTKYLVADDDEPVSEQRTGGIGSSGK